MQEEKFLKVPPLWLKTAAPFMHCIQKPDVRDDKRILNPEPETRNPNPET